LLSRARCKAAALRCVRVQLKSRKIAK
jgi:hypothetical protein